MIEAIGLLAAAAIGGLCFSAGTLIGARRQSGQHCIHCADMKAEVLRCRELMDEASKAMELYEKLFREAKPILEEHTWHSMKAKQ
jgi:hypothetical protein